MIFTTKRLILRPWVEADAEDLYAWAKDSRIGSAAGWLPHPDAAYSREIIRTVFCAPEVYAVCRRTDNRAIGSIGLSVGSASNFPLPGTEGELGYWIAAPFWGKGLIPEAAKALIRHGFDDLGLEKLWCGYFDGNDQSRRVQEKCGFRYHHTNRDILWEKTNEIRTEHVSCLLPEQFRALLAEESL